MKFQNPRTGEIFDNYAGMLDDYCPAKEDTSNKYCKTCAFAKIQTELICTEYAEMHPEETAKIIGYEVIDDSKGVDFDPVNPNQTAKADAGKARLSLVPFQIVYDIARVREHGNRKYGDPDNWKQVEPSRYVDALLRHTLAFAEDNHSLDAESGLPHLWHAACNLAFLCEMLKEEYDGMDKR